MKLSTSRSRWRANPRIERLDECSCQLRVAADDAGPVSRDGRAPRAYESREEWRDASRWQCRRRCRARWAYVGTDHGEVAPAGQSEAGGLEVRHITVIVIAG